jgi:hypothetical protein
MSTRKLVQILCQTEGRNPGDRRLLANVTKRASKALREVRRMGIVQSVVNWFSDDVDVDDDL